jgi:Tol biopolymer transport system component
VIGTKIGSFEITGKLGEGGMGEVYRASDRRLKREVAIKVLPRAFTSDPERLARFEREAQLLAQLHHPNIASIFGLEEADGVRALVMELVEGPTLGERLAAGPLDIEGCCAIGRQVAEALEAAHDKGIIHRDLKPANIKVTPDGTVKVLDFGLAKALDGGASSSEVGPATLMNSPTLTSAPTQIGMILGTAAYMSPEQARGGLVDKRTDIWSFGVVLYEMLTGHRLFEGDTASDTLAAVLRQEVDLGSLPEPTPPAVRRLLARCLERNPKNRLRDIGEARIALHAAAGESTGSAEQAEPAAPAEPGTRRALARHLWGAIVLALLSGALLAGAVAVLWFRPAALLAAPEFQRLTFRRGTVSNARFAPDGNIVYSARWGDGVNQIESVRPTSPESRLLGFTDATLYAVSSAEELALRLRPRYWSTLFHGTLARVALAGGTPREVTENVQEADWTPDGGSYATLRLGEGFAWQIEYPPGKVLVKSMSYALTALRFSPDGKHIAYASGGQWTISPQVSVVDLAGKSRILSTDEHVSGIAWTPSGEEVWFTKVDGQGESSLRAVDLDGHERVVLRSAGALVLRDIAKDGSVLASVDRNETNLILKRAGDDRERDFSWLDSSVASDMSADGKTLLFNETGTGAGNTGSSIYVRPLDGSAPPVRLGDGYGNSLSPDGRWVAGHQLTKGDEVEIVPTGPGNAQLVPLPRNMTVSGFQVWFFPDGKRVLVNASGADGSPRLIAVDLARGTQKIVLPPKWDNFIGEIPISPDGQWINAERGRIGAPQCTAFRSDGSGVGRPVKGYLADDVVIRWTADNRGLFVYQRNELPARVDRLDIDSGTRTHWLDLMPADSAGVVRIQSVVMTPDGKTYAYNVSRQLSDLYLIRGLR